MNYWLVKSEPGTFSITDLKNAKNQTTFWDGVRNFKARNYLRDEMKKGDMVLFYHSNADPTGVFGYCEVVKEGYPDPTAFDPESNHYDPDSSFDNPRWYMVDLKFVKELKKPVTLADIKANSKLRKMILVQKGNRLSVMPVAKEEFDIIINMGKG